MLSTSTYDGSSLRVKKVAGSNTTRYIFSGTKVVAEYLNGALNKEYIYGGSQLLATLNSSGTPTYHHPDHLSIRVNSDTSGAIVGQQGHYPFGESWYSQSTTTKWQFTSYERDSESSLDYAIFRYDSSRLGRFQTPDPLAGSIRNPQSLNRYAYVLNDPINLVDPLGLACLGPQPAYNCICACVDAGNGEICNWDCSGPTLVGSGGGADTMATTFWEFGMRSRRGRFTGAPCPAGDRGINGAGYVLGGMAAGGVPGAAAAATTSVGGGAFHDPNKGLTEGWSTGEFATDGILQDYPGSDPADNVPNQPPSSGVLGAFLGGGAGGWISNATSMSALSGDSKTLSFDVGFIVKVSFQSSMSANGNWMMSLTFGPGFGLAATEMNTVTTPQGDDGCVP